MCQHTLPGICREPWPSQRGSEVSLEPVSQRRDLLRNDAAEDRVPGKVRWMLIFQNKGKISFQIFHGDA